jgi:hypothetical protein
MGAECCVGGLLVKAVAGPGVHLSKSGVKSQCTPFTESRLMNIASVSQDVYGFAVELRKLAYTMPGGHEDPLIRLSDRMVNYARRQVADERRKPTG